MAVTATIAVATPFSPAVVRKAGRWGLGPVPGFRLQEGHHDSVSCVHHDSVSITAEPAKPTCRPSAEPWREPGEGLHARGWARIPRRGSPGTGPPGPGWSCSQTLAPSWFSLAFPQQSGVALALPQEQVAFAAWHLFLRAAARKVQTWGSPCMSSEPLHEACSLPGGARLGLSWRRRSQRGLFSSPEPPSHPAGESQESQDRHPEVCGLGACRRGARGDRVKGRG